MAPTTARWRVIKRGRECGTTIAYLVFGVAPRVPDRKDACVAGQDLLDLTPSFYYHVIAHVTRHCDICARSSGVVRTRATFTETPSGKKRERKRETKKSRKKSKVIKILMNHVCMCRVMVEEVNKATTLGLPSGP